jgi:signal transduction histidine kinase
LVLVVDDEAENRRVLSRQLVAEQFDVLTASSGAEALNQLHAHDVDIALIDVLMPEMDGIELTRRLKQDPKLIEVPVIVMTGFVDAPARLRALMAGAEEFLSRPIDRTEMAVRIRNLLRMRATHQALRQKNLELARLLEQESEKRERTSEDLRAAKSQLEATRSEVRETQSQLESSRLQVVHAQKLESMGRLTDGVSHDFNNLLTSIICYTRFVVDDMADADPRRSDLVEVLKAADSAARLVNQLLVFSRRKPTQPTIVNVNDALSSVGRVLRRALGERIELDISVAAEPLYVLCDPGQFDQLVFNLTVNAKDAMPDGGQISLKLSRVTEPADRSAQAGDYAELLVIDSGVGMKPDVAAHAFEPFFTTKGERGSGLGLATCQAIVQQAGGSISFRSRDGGGTSFRVLLPRAQERERSDAGRRSQLPIGLSGSVLVVEDQPTILRMMVRALTNAGLSVIEAGSAEAALSALESRSGPAIDLVVTDMVLPRMSGEQLVEHLRATAPGLKAMYVSGYAVEENAVRTDGSTDFLAKPFSARQLVARASSLLAKR